MGMRKIRIKCDPYYKYLIRDCVSTIGEIIFEKKDGYIAKIDLFAMERKDDHRSDLGRIYRMVEEYSTSVVYI